MFDRIIKCVLALLCGVAAWVLIKFLLAINFLGANVP